VIFILLVLLLILDDLLPLNGNDLISVLLFVSPLHTEDVALFAQAEDDVVCPDGEEKGVLEDFEALS
jgi:hypothetical protein